MILDLKQIRKLLFYLALMLHCVIGGMIAFVGVIPFRPFYVSLLVILSLIIYKIKIDNLLKFHLLFGALIVASGFINGSSIGSIISALRLPIISQTMYLVVFGYLDNEKYNIEWILKVIALIQLPIVIFQMAFYTPLSELSAIETAYFDIRYGTFFVKSDSIMSTFLILIVIYLLFVKKVLNKLNLLVIVSACLSVFLADSRISQITLLGILGYYTLINSSFKQKIGIIILLGSVFVLFYATGYAEKLAAQFGDIIGQITFQRGVSMERFEEGQYARAAAILYFISEPLKIFGDGPGRYINPLTGEMELGLQSQYLKSYAELGLAGMIVSILGIFIIVKSLIKTGFFRYIVIFTILALGVTSDIYNDAGLMFVLFLMIHLMSSQEFKLQEVNQDPQSDSI